jgi:ribonuclease HII
MRRAVEALGVLPTEVLIDGNRCPQLAIPARAIIGGDATEPAISAASILAKTARDAEMLRIHAAFPEYGLDRHKGYDTAIHRAALNLHGPAPFHRRSFAPVRVLLQDAE